MPLAGTLTVVAVEDAKAVRDWLAVPHIVYVGDPAWVAPLEFLERRRISPRHAPFFAFGEARLFLAYRGRRPVDTYSTTARCAVLMLTRANTAGIVTTSLSEDSMTTIGSPSGTSIAWLPSGSHRSAARPAS